MAKLTAYGADVVLRASRERDVTNPDRLVTWEKTSLAVRRHPNGRLTLLTKRDVKFPPDAYDPNGRRHSYGWKNGGRISKTLDQVREVLTRQGWTIE